jgi:hypothetical protein
LNARASSHVPNDNRTSCNDRSGPYVHTVYNRRSHADLRARPNPAVAPDVRARIYRHTALKNGVMSNQCASPDKQMILKHRRRAEDGKRTNNAAQPDLAACTQNSAWMDHGGRSDPAMRGE